MRSKVKKAKDVAPLDFDSDEALTWECPSCGAENANFETTCNECKAERPGTQAAKKDFEDKEDEAEAPLPEASEAGNVDLAKDEDHEYEPETAPSLLTPPPTPPPTPQLSTPPPASPFTGVAYTPQTTDQGRYYFVFVNTPAQSLIKAKVPIDFDLFPVVTIGRSPENIIVIPDQEVSRKHAELTMDGNKLIIKDLNSKNGTYVYDGKQFQQVNDSAEVKPNTIVKFGTGTIVRLTSE